jgi:hypothetical protein
MMAEPFDLGLVETLPRLGLPRQDPGLGDPLIKDMSALLLAEGHEEEKVSRPIRDGDDPMQAPRPDLRGEGRVGAKVSWTSWRVSSW